VHSTSHSFVHSEDEESRDLFWVRARFLPVTNYQVRDDPASTFLKGTKQGNGDRELRPSPAPCTPRPATACRAWPSSWDPCCPQPPQFARRAALFGRHVPFLPPAAPPAAKAGQGLAGRWPRSAACLADAEISARIPWEEGVNS